MQLIFLNRFFYPDHSATSQILSDVAFALAATGERVIVITSRQQYDAPRVRFPARETTNGVEIFRVWTSHFGRTNLVGRSVDYLTFYLSAAFVLLRLARRGDVIVAKTDPPMLSILAAPVAWLRGARLVNWVQDIFPEIAEALGVGNDRFSRTAYRIMHILRDRSWRAARMNVVLGELMAERLSSLGIARDNIRVIPNFADGGLIRTVPHADNDLRKAWGLEGKFVAGYSGNLGRAHEYATLLEAIAATETNAERVGSGCAQILWLLIGGGALFEAFRQEVNARGLKTVRFQPYQPREKLAQSLSAIDVHLVSLRPALEGLVVPSKVYGTAAAGRPILFIGNKHGEVGSMLARCACGLTVDEGDSDGLARAVHELAADPQRCQELGANARRAFDSHFDKAHAVARWRDLISDLQP